MTADQVRIQRKRVKGWRMPEGAAYVGRPTKWGNPFWHAQKFCGVDVAVALYADLVHGIWNPTVLRGEPDALVDIAYEARTDWLARIGGHPTEIARYELSGRDLCCWCKPDAPCHADVLLELANTP